MKCTMCEFEHLFFNDAGYIIRCKECRHYQISFKTALFALNEEEFVLFQYSLVRKLRDYDEQLNSCRSMVIATPISGFCLMLTLDETKQLHNMLEEADNEMKALRLMELFSK